MLMDNTITIEYGEDLSETGTIHEGMLLNCSEKLQTLFTKARPLRKSYATCKKMYEKIEFCLMHQSSSKYDMEKETEAEVCFLNHLPLLKQYSSIFYSKNIQ
jgi:hypothetical protein